MEWTYVLNKEASLVFESQCPRIWQLSAPNHKSLVIWQRGAQIARVLPNRCKMSSNRTFKSGDLWFEPALSVTVRVATPISVHQVRTLRFSLRFAIHDSNHKSQRQSTANCSTMYGRLWLPNFRCRLTGSETNRLRFDWTYSKLRTSDLTALGPNLIQILAASGWELSEQTACLCAKRILLEESALSAAKSTFLHEKAFFCRKNLFSVVCSGG